MIVVVGIDSIASGAVHREVDTVSMRFATHWPGATADCCRALGWPGELLPGDRNRDRPTTVHDAVRAKSFYNTPRNRGEPRAKH